MARYMGGSRANVKLGLGDRSFYNPAQLNTLDSKELRKEYSRLRSIARKRLNRFAGSEWEWTAQYRYNKDRFVRLENISNDRELVHKLSDLARFLTASTGTVSGLQRQRKESIQALHRHGYTFVNKANFRDFTDFMDWARDLHIGSMFDSKRVANFYGDVYTEDTSAEDVKAMFIDWVEKQKEEGRYRATEGKRPAKVYREGLRNV